MHFWKTLCNAVKSNNKDLVSFLLNVEKVNPNPGLCESWIVDPVHVQFNELSPLMIACCNNNLDIVRMLITNPHHPADPTLPDQDGRMPFEQALSSGSIELIEILITESLDTVNLNNKDCHSTPLTLAARKGSLHVVWMLLSAGADPNLKPCSDDHPITIAIRARNTDLCKLLLRNGCDPNTVVPPASNLVPCSVTESYMVINLAIRYSMLEIVQLLHDKDADIISTHYTILKASIESYNSEILEYCLRHVYKKLDIDVALQKSDQLLATAVKSHAGACLDVLLHWGNYSCNYSLSIWPESPRVISLFQMAAEYTNIKAMKMLIQFNPQCLQESWLVDKSSNTSRDLSVMHKTFWTEITEKQKHPSMLTILCRAKIIQRLGCKPVEKVQKLPLPNMLKSILQFKNAK